MKNRLLEDMVLLLAVSFVGNCFDRTAVKGTGLQSVIPCKITYARCIVASDAVSDTRDESSVELRSLFATVC